MFPDHSYYVRVWNFRHFFLTYFRPPGMFFSVHKKQWLEHRFNVFRNFLTNSSLSLNHTKNCNLPSQASRLLICKNYTVNYTTDICWKLLFNLKVWALKSTFLPENSHLDTWRSSHSGCSFVCNMKVNPQIILKLYHRAYRSK